MVTPCGKIIEIIKYIAADWHDRVGIHLNFDSTGRTLALIRARNRSDPEACCIDMMMEWLEGRGRQPANWATLVNVLKDAEFSVLAEDVEQLLVTGGGSEGDRPGRKDSLGGGIEDEEGYREGGTLRTKRTAEPGEEHLEASRKKARFCSSSYL